MSIAIDLIAAVSCGVSRFGFVLLYCCVAMFKIQVCDLCLPLLLCSVSDLNPEVNYYWHHGEEVVVHGHRKGRVDPVRFQIDDKPHLQIRVPKQLPEV